MLIEVMSRGKANPPAGATVIVQIRDTSEADAAARVLGEARATASGEAAVASLEVLMRAPAKRPTIWVHADVDGDGRVSTGDYITTQSYPVEPGRERMQVAVTQV